MVSVKFGHFAAYCQLYRTQHMSVTRAVSTAARSSVATIGRTSKLSISYNFAHSFQFSDSLCIFYVRVTVHRNKFLRNKTN